MCTNTTSIFNKKNEYYISINLSFLIQKNWVKSYINWIPNIQKEEKSVRLGLLGLMADSEDK